MRGTTPCPVFSVIPKKYYCSRRATMYSSSFIITTTSTRSEKHLKKCKIMQTKIIYICQATMMCIGPHIIFFEYRSSIVVAVAIAILLVVIIIKVITVKMT